MLTKRTDLAMEAKQLWQKSAGETTRLEGVEADEFDKEGCRVTVVRIVDENGSRALNKPVGNYVTVELTELSHNDEDALLRSAKVVSEQLKKMLNLPDKASVLVVGLGNKAVTPDAVGPLALKSTMVTRHLAQHMPEVFGQLRHVSALAPGVLGTTGIESAEIIKGVVSRCFPDCVIIIDALASMSLSRLCKTIQIADTGITPGSGVGNSRAEMSQSTLGIPVIAVGAPTVVDATTLAIDLMEQAGLTGIDPGRIRDLNTGMIVTPKDIDDRLAGLSRVIGYAINLTLHGDMAVSDMMQYLS